MDSKTDTTRQRCALSIARKIRPNVAAMLIFSVMIGVAMSMQKSPRNDPYTGAVIPSAPQITPVVPRTRSRLIKRREIIRKRSFSTSSRALFRPRSSVMQKYPNRSASFSPSNTSRPYRGLRVPSERSSFSTSSRADAATQTAPRSSQVSLHAAAPASVGSASDAAFPPFGNAIFPVSATPNWGIMETPDEWERTFGEMTPEDFVPIPKYDLSQLTIPVQTLLKKRQESVPVLTAKLFYSTRHFGAYNLDSNEFSAVHPGIDLKLALGTPVRAVGGGIVHYAAKEGGLGLHVILEHHVQDEVFYSIYGHLGSASVQKGQVVRAGDTIGRVGMSGYTTAPHLHLQIDRKVKEEVAHTPYWPTSVPDPGQAALYTMHPIAFIQQYSNLVVVEVR